MRYRYHRMLRSILLFCALLGIYVGGPSSPLAAGELRISGTGSALGALRQIAAAYEKDQGTKFVLPPSMGSSGGIKAVEEGALDIAVTSRPLKDIERKWGLSEVEYARTLFVPIAHPSVQAKDISRADIVGALTGALTAWPNGERVRFVLRPESDTDSQMLRSLSPEISKAVDVAREREGMLVAMTDQNNADMIERTPGAVGFSSLGLVITEQRPVKVLSLDGVRPEAARYRSGAYGPVKSLYLVTRTDASAEVNAFVRFVLSPRGMQILERTGNIPLRVAPASR